MATKMKALNVSADAAGREKSYEQVTEALAAAVAEGTSIGLQVVHVSVRGERLPSGPTWNWQVEMASDRD